MAKTEQLTGLPPIAAPETKTERLNNFARVAVPICRIESYPPEMLLAQWAVESSWGAAEAGKNNVFGMTKAARHATWEWVKTWEILSAEGIAKLPAEERSRIVSKELRPDGKFKVRLERKFAAFESIQHAILDKINLIKNGAPYKRLFAKYAADGSLNDLIKSVAAVYATDPNYGQLLLTVSKQKNILDAIKANEKISV